MPFPQAPRDDEGSRGSSSGGSSSGGWGAYSRYASLGIQFVVAMCFFGWVGWWLDGKLGTYPLIMIIGFFLGAAGGFVSLLYAIPPIGARTKRESSPPSSNASPSPNASPTPNDSTRARSERDFPQ